MEARIRGAELPDDFLRFFLSIYYGMVAFIDHELGRLIEALKRRGDYDRLHPNSHVNLSQSTNDVYPTAIRLALHAAVVRRHVVGRGAVAVPDLGVGRRRRRRSGQTLPRR